MMTEAMRNSFSFGVFITLIYWPLMRTARKGKIRATATRRFSTPMQWPRAPVTNEAVGHSEVIDREETAKLQKHRRIPTAGFLTSAASELVDHIELHAIEVAVLG